MTVETKYRLTAGHCFTGADARDEWFHGEAASRLIGPFGAEVYKDNSTFDGGYIKVLDKGDSNNLLYLQPLKNRYMVYVQKRGADAVGNRVCLSGVTTDGICGFITDRNYTANVHQDGVITTLLNQRKADFVAKPGDSGGPVYTGFTMKGVLSAGTNTFSTYSHIDYLTDHFPNKRVMRDSTTLNDPGPNPFDIVDISGPLEEVPD